jgi:hypothetical protein
MTSEPIRADERKISEITARTQGVALKRFIATLIGTIFVFFDMCDSAWGKYERARDLLPHLKSGEVDLRSLTVALFLFGLVASIFVLSEHIRALAMRIKMLVTLVRDLVRTAKTSQTRSECLIDHPQIGPLPPLF